MDKAFKNGFFECLNVISDLFAPPLKKEINVCLQIFLRMQDN